jgi:hypothetical protein
MKSVSGVIRMWDRRNTTQLFVNLCFNLRTLYRSCCLKVNVYVKAISCASVWQTEGNEMEVITWLWSLIKTSTCLLRACSVGKHSNKLTKVMTFMYGYFPFRKCLDK